MKKRRNIFTPALIRRMYREERGTDLGPDYVPWHQVRRGEPSSKGRSHLVDTHFTRRQHHLLSDHEYFVFCLATMLQGVSDIREQFPLSIEEERAEPSFGSINYGRDSLPGTLDICKSLQIKHPLITGPDGDEEVFVLSTDLFVDLTIGDRKKHLAISVKPGSRMSERTRAKLKVEETYWLARGVPWRLITPVEYRRCICEPAAGFAVWALSRQRVPQSQLRELAGRGWLANPIAWDVAVIRASREFGQDIDWAQRAFSQAFWCGIIPLDWRALHEHTPVVRCLSRDAFRAQNVLANGGHE